MKKILIFGAGDCGRRYVQYVSEYIPELEICAVVDNVRNNNGAEISRITPDEISTVEYDEIHVSNRREKDQEEIRTQLLNLGIPEEKMVFIAKNPALIEQIYAKTSNYDARVYPRAKWIKNFAYYVGKMGIEGNVAECGVWRGYFSHYINRAFPDRKLYLFDTFEGFTTKDIQAEREIGDKKFTEGEFNIEGRFSDTSLECVMNQMRYPEQCIVRKGYFPETAFGIEDKFCFVMLDMDLYQPMLAGLEFFYDKMVSGGVILLHDYFHPDLPGVEKAIIDFEEKLGHTLIKTVIGDNCSIAVIKP